MKITKSNNLSFYNEQGILTLNAKQFDTSRTFVFHLMDNDEPFVLPEDCTASLQIQKADGTQFQGEDCCIIEGSKITINPALGNGQQILAADGVNICELILKDSKGGILTTWNFHINVLKRVHNGENLKSSDAYDVLDKINNAEKIRKANETIRIEAENTRIESENTRIQAENARIETENTRIESENTRIEAENKRIQAENTRIQAENKRNEDTAKVIAEAKEATEKCIEINHTADASAISAESWAHGGTGTRTGENVDNAKYYKEQAQEICENLKKSTVTGVKGNAESEYRIGNVNLTSENIGALSLKKGGTVNNTFKVNKVSSTDPTGLTEINVSSDGKVAFNANADNNLKTNSLLFLEGGPDDGYIVNKGKTIYNYAPKHSYANDSSEILYGSMNIGYSKSRAQSNGAITYMALQLLHDSIHIGHNKARIRVEENGTDGANIQVKSPLIESICKHILLKGNPTYIQEWTNELYISGPEVHIGYTYGASESKYDGANEIVIRDDSIRTILNNDFEIHMEHDGSNSDYINIGKSCDYLVQGRYRPDNSSKLLKLRGGSNSSIEMTYDNNIKFGSDGGAFEFHSFTNSDKLIASILQNGYMKLTGLKGINTTEGLLIDGNTKISGNLRLRKNNDNSGGKLNFGDNEYTYISNYNDNLKICSDELNLAADFVYIGYDSNSGINKSSCFVFEPDSGLYPMANYMTLGFPSYKWDALYANNGTIQTSDRNEKNHIEELSTEKSQKLIYGLKPSTYQMNNGTSGRTHWGMISQDIEDLLKELGWTSLDFAGFIKSPKIKETKTVTDENGNTKKIHEYIDGAYDYSLRYDEFIAPMNKVIQSQHEHIETLAQKLELLERKIANEK